MFHDEGNLSRLQREDKAEFRQLLHQNNEPEQFPTDVFCQSDPESDKIKQSSFNYQAGLQGNNWKLRADCYPIEDRVNG